MISPPSVEEIRCAFNEAQIVYPPIAGLNSKILLVPHAGIHESRIVTAATLSYLSNEPGEIILLGTNHEGLRISRLGLAASPLLLINGDTTEHSLTINKAFLSYMNKSCHMALIDPDADPNYVAKLLTNWLQQSINNVLIVSSDLSHYHTNQEQDNINETELIQGLIEANYYLTDNSLNKVNACGNLVLKVITRITNILESRGIVTCYNDSRNKRLGWYTINGTREVSYLGMIWIHSKLYNRNLISSFDQQHLVAFAKSCTIANLLSAPIPELPSWSRWHRFSNGAFVGIKDSNGDTRASIGNYQTYDTTIVDNVRTSAIGIVNDAIVRWKHPLSIRDIDTYVFYINILQDKSEWIEYSPVFLIGNITPTDNYGFYLKIGNLRSTFLPSVWEDIVHNSGEPPYKTFPALMTQLTKKAGGTGLEWKSEAARVQLYRTLYIELHMPIIC